MIVQLKEDAPANLEISVTHVVSRHLPVVGELLDLVPGGTHEADPVVGWLTLEGRDVAAQMVHLGTTVATVQLAAVVAYSAPFVL